MFKYLVILTSTYRQHYMPEHFKIVAFSFTGLIQFV